MDAIRLPNNTFKGRANTGVTTDIVLFKKGFDATSNKDWIESKSYIQREGKEYNINECLLNPQHIAGDLELVTTEHKDYKIICTPNKDKVLTLQLDAFIKSLPKDVYRYRETTYKQDMKIIPKDSLQYQHIKDYLATIESGNYFVLEDEIYQKTKLETQDNIQVVISLIPNQKDKTRIVKMIAIRDTLNSLITLEKNSQENQVLDPLRQKLNRLYDDFVKTEGYLNRDVNKKAFRYDRHSNKILALEKNYNKGISKSVAIKHGVAPMNPSAEKSDIFYKRTIALYTKVVAHAPKEALIASLNEFGNIDLDYMQELLQKSVNDINNSSNKITQYSKDSIKNSLLHEKLIFINHNNPSEYILANHYLSGNVKKKYKEVKAILEDMQSSMSNDLRMHLESNLESLEQILPKDLKATQINAEFGAAWIPMSYLL
ncbi:hypothetical protein [Helicobacter bilis]|uniref:hypothetical protein n=2 Tax=Helicobacteraceae TaxID=72293 RepID=UPI000984ABBE|nr:hypothetical protein [Helicobacter bilis]